MGKNYDQELKQLISEYSDDELIENYNRNANPAMGGRKATYLSLLYIEMKIRQIDLSAMKADSGWMRLIKGKMVVINGVKHLVPLDFDTTLIEHEIEDDLEDENDDECDDPAALYCPICEEKCVCGHLVMIFDETYNTVQGGDIYEYIDSFKSVLTEGIFNFSTKMGSNVKFQKDSLQRLLLSTQKQAAQNADELEIDDEIFYEILISLLMKNGAEFSDEDYVSSSGPGYSSSESFMFAKNPDETIKKSMMLLKSFFE